MATRIPPHTPPFHRRPSQTCLEAALAVLALAVPVGGAVMPAGAYAANIDGITVDGSAVDDGSAVYKGADPYTSAGSGAILWGGSALKDAPGAENSHVVSVTSNIASGYGILGGGTTNGSAATGNTVNLISATSAAFVSGADFYVIGGAALSGGDAHANSVSMVSGTTVEGTIIGGAVVGSGDAHGNVIVINGGTVGKSVVGGVTDSGNVSANSATVSGATVGQNVIGGSATSGNATGNVVTVTEENAVVSGYVAGGYTLSGNATSNTASINNSAVVSGNVYGGYAVTGDADNNSASIAGSAQITDGKNVYGGFTSGGNVAGNTVVVTGAGTLVEGLVAGGYTVSGTATSNTASLNSGATVSGSVYGGYASAGNATGNSANVGASATSAIVSGAVYGGYVANSGSATSNVVNVAGNGTVVSGVIAGGYVVASGAASDNTVSIDNSAVVSGAVYGGYTSAGDANNNSVSIAGSAQIADGKDVYGGYTSEGGVTGNAVVVTGAGTLVEGLVAGGYTISGAAASNTVSIDNSATVSGAVYGGYTSAGNVTGNKVNIGASATVSGAVYGGYTSAGDATGNTVTISGGTIVGDIFGGEATGSGNTAMSNGVTFGSGSFAVANVYGGANSTTSAGDVFTGNTLTLGAGANVSAGQVDHFATISLGNSASLANSTGSSVVLGDGSALTEITVTAGGTASLADAVLTGTGFTKTGAGTLNLGSAANSHSANIIAEGTLAISNVSALGSATSNVLSGGTLSLSTSGGAYTPSWAIGAGTSNVITASDDVSIGSSGGSHAIQFDPTSGGAVVFGGGHAITVFGGIKNHDGGEVYVSGSSTNLVLSDATSTTQIPADSRYSFTKMTVGEDARLVLGGGVELTTNKLVLEEDSTISGGSSAVYNVLAKDDGDEQPDVIVNGGVTISGPTNSGETFALNISGAAIAFSGSQSGYNKFLDLGSGVKLTLNEVTLDYTDYEGDVSKAFDASKVTGLEKIYSQKGFLTEYYWKEGAQYVKATEQAKALSEGFLGGIGLLTLGGDLVTGQGIASAARGVARSGGAGQSFAALGGGKLKYKTGSHVDVSGTALVAGLAAGVGNGATVGGFVEYGNGDYDSHNSFSRGKVKGSGDTEYIGIGILGRFELPRNASGQPYLEATARFGRVESDFATGNFLLANGDVGPRAKYDIKSSYHGLSFGGGHVWNVGTNSAFDLYGRYVWTHQAGDSVTLSGYDEDVKFSAVDSHRLRFGGRYSSKLGNTNSFYAGAAWEHEFDGEANAKVDGAGKIDAPEMKGSTGLAEFGFVFVPADNKNLSIDLGLQVYGGKRSGATGGAKLKYEF